MKIDDSRRTSCLSNNLEICCDKDCHSNNVRNPNISNPDDNNNQSNDNNYNDYDNNDHYDNGKNEIDYNVHNDNHDKNGYENQKNQDIQINIDNNLKNENNGMEICYSENTFYDPNYDHNNYINANDNNNDNDIIQNETTIDIIDNIAKGLLSLETINFPLENSNFSYPLPLPPSSLNVPSPLTNNLSDPLPYSISSSLHSLTDATLTITGVHSKNNDFENISNRDITNDVSTAVRADNNSSSSDIFSYTSMPTADNYSAKSHLSDISSPSRNTTKPRVPLFISSPSSTHKNKPENNRKNNDDMDTRNEKNDIHGNSAVCTDTSIHSNLPAPIEMNLFTPGTNPVMGTDPATLETNAAIPNSDIANGDIISIEKKSDNVNFLPTYISPTKFSSNTCNLNIRDSNIRDSNIRDPNIRDLDNRDPEIRDSNKNIFSPISNRYSMMALDFPANSLIMFGGG